MKRFYAGARATTCLARWSRRGRRCGHRRTARTAPPGSRRGRTSEGRFRNSSWIRKRWRQRTKGPQRDGNNSWKSTRAKPARVLSRRRTSTRFMSKRLRRRSRRRRTNPKKPPFPENKNVKNRDSLTRKANTLKGLPCTRLPWKSAKTRLSDDAFWRRNGAFCPRRRNGKYFPFTTFRRLIAHTRLTFIFTISGNARRASRRTPPHARNAPRLKSRRLSAAPRATRGSSRNHNACELSSPRVSPTTRTRR